MAPQGAILDFGMCVMRIALSVVLAFLCGCSAFHREDSLRVWRDHPSGHQFSYEDVVVTTSSSLRLHGWWLKARGPVRATVYYLHDRQGNIGDQLKVVGSLPEDGINVFMLDYQGFGFSEGRRVNATREDLLAGLDWLRVGERSAGAPLVVLVESAVAGDVVNELSQEAHRGRVDCILDVARAGVIADASLRYDDGRLTIESIARQCPVVPALITSPEVAPKPLQNGMPSNVVPRFTF